LFLCYLTPPKKWSRGAGEQERRGVRGGWEEKKNIYTDNLPTFSSAPEGH